MKTIVLSDNTVINDFLYVKGEVITVSDTFDPTLIAKTVQDKPEKTKLKDKPPKEDKKP